METLNKCILLRVVNSMKDLLTDMQNRRIIYDEQKRELTASLSDVLANLTKPLIVTLVGPFSSGKTTFINAIIKERILPESIAPCTGMVCNIGYCDSSLKIQYLQDGVKIVREIAVEELKNFVDINDPCYIHRDIGDVLEIFHKNDFCERDIILVDTPGFNDPNLQDDATNKALEKADVVVYCMSAIHAYSGTDKVKIGDLHSKGINSIFYIIGFMDVIFLNDKNTGNNEMELFKNMKVKELSSQTALQEKGVFFVSAADELSRLAKKSYLLEDNGIDNVRIKIWEYLQDNRVPIKIENARNTLNKICAQMETNIKNELERKRQQVGKYEQKIIIYKKNRDEARKCVDSIDEICSTYEDDVHLFVRTQIEAEMLNINENIEKWVDEIFDFFLDFLFYSN